MTTRRVLPVAAAALALCVSSLSGTAWAGPPEEATGFFQQTAPPVVVSEETKGNVTHSRLTDQVLTQGNLLSSTEPAMTDYRCVFKEGKDIHCRGEGSGTFTVAGVGTGEAESRLNFRCTFVSPTDLRCAGHIQIRGISGQIASVHAMGTFENTGRPGQSSYSLRLHRH